MKKTIRYFTALTLSAAVLLSLSSCTLFEKIRETASQETVIYTDPAENDVIRSFNEALSASSSGCSDIDWSVEFKVSGTSVTNAKDNASLLDKASAQIKNFIMAAKPGSASGKITDNNTSNTLLAALDEAAMLKYDYTRNYATKTLLDEKGNEITNENSESVTEKYVSDNFLNLTVNYFEDIPVDGEWDETVPAEETNPANADETTTEEETTRVYSSDATIESVFGEPRDKQAILEAFDCVSDYLKVNDYSLKYTDCKISSVMDLESSRLNSLVFEKKMLVTASVTGIGSLSEYGDMTVTFTVDEKSSYTFNWIAATEAAEAGSQTENTAATTTADTATATTAAAEENTSGN